MCSWLAPSSPDEAPEIALSRIAEGSRPLARALAAERRPARGALVAIVAWHAALEELAPDALEPDLAFLAGELDRARRSAAESVVGRLLAPALDDAGLSAEPFREALEARRRDGSDRASETRAELVERADQLASPFALLVLSALARRTERNEALARALARGIELARWSVGLGREWRRGRLRVAVEDLRAYGVALEELDAPPARAELRGAAAEVATAAVAELERGWPLAPDLGPARGRRLARLLRRLRSRALAVERGALDPLEPRPRWGGPAAALATLPGWLTARPPRWPLLPPG